MLVVPVLLLFFFSSLEARYGPTVIASKGEVWPKPQVQDKLDEYYLIRPDTFTFKPPEDLGCPNFLNDALVRYWNIINQSAQKTRQQRHDGYSLGYLDTLDITLIDDCPGEGVLPSLGDPEDYNITIGVEGGASLSASTIWGVLRGLETFSQLIYQEGDSMRIHATTILDFPRFPHRGLLIDTSRHFQPVSIIFQMLDAMAYNKMNVFHWHIVDDHSFPYKSRTYPELSDASAYHPVLRVYQQSDVAAVIEYARLRGIRVIPEFDTPGHTSSWGVSHPELLTSCNGELGPMDPTQNSTYDFMTNLLAEVVDVFPDQYFHVGGDEVDFTCWQNNPSILEYMTERDLTQFEDLQSLYIQQILAILDNLDTKYLVWEEVFTGGALLPNSTIVQVWKDLGLIKLREVALAGNYGIFSSCWYLSGLFDGADWGRFYICEPLALIDDDEARKLVLGGEACMWGEYVNEYSIIPRVWPRASAVAERLWSDINVSSISQAQPRLEEHTCRMNKRGIAAQPANGPGVCL